jgi:hypothetical protein
VWSPWPAHLIGRDFTADAPCGATPRNTNGLLRQYFPKGTDLSKHSPANLNAVTAALNARSRKTHGWKTPAEALNEHLLLPEQAGVATTP